MKLSYNGGGTIKARGVAKFSKKVVYPYKFAVNSEAYVKKQALLGVMEKIIINKVFIGNNRYTYYQQNNVYEDTLKSLYEEKDLITESEARELALQFWTTRRDLIVNTLVSANTYGGNGVVKVSGSAKYSKKVAYPYKYALNSAVYVKRKAEAGTLERVIISKVLIGNNIYTQYQQNVMYEDNLKSLYAEHELITETEARSLALSYWTKRRNLIMDEIVQEVAPQNNTNF